jgi:Flp pilus assembly pilin Flp
MGRINCLSEFFYGKISLFLCTKSGATSIEYAIIAMGIAVGLIAIARPLGMTLIGLLQNINIQIHGN